MCCRSAPSHRRTSLKINPLSGAYQSVCSNLRPLSLDPSVEITTARKTLPVTPCLRREAPGCRYFMCRKSRPAIRCCRKFLQIKFAPYVYPLRPQGIRFSLFARFQFKARALDGVEFRRVGISGEYPLAENRNRAEGRFNFVATRPIDRSIARPASDPASPASVIQFGSDR